MINGFFLKHKQFDFFDIRAIPLLYKKCIDLLKRNYENMRKKPFGTRSRKKDVTWFRCCFW